MFTSWIEPRCEKASVEETRRMTQLAAGRRASWSAADIKASCATLALAFDDDDEGVEYRTFGEFCDLAELIATYADCGVQLLCRAEVGSRLIPESALESVGSALAAYLLAAAADGLDGAAERAAVLGVIWHLAGH